STLFPYTTLFRSPGGRTPRPSLASDASVEASQSGNSCIVISLSPRLTREDGSGASCAAGTRAVRANPLARLAHKRVGVGRAEINLLALRDQIALVLGAEHRLWGTCRHQPVRSADGH